MFIFTLAQLEKVVSARIELACASDDWRPNVASIMSPSSVESLSKSSSRNASLIAGNMSVVLRHSLQVLTMYRTSFSVAFLSVNNHGQRSRYDDRLPFLRQPLGDHRRKAR